MAQRQAPVADLKYLLKIDLSCFDGQPSCPKEGQVIKLSDVKVRVQYRLRVRQRLMVLHFAGLHGPTAAGRRFGVSVRTIRRWRVRWMERRKMNLLGRPCRDSRWLLPSSRTCTAGGSYLRSIQKVSAAV